MTKRQRQIMLPKYVCPLQRVLVTVFQLVFMSFHYHVISGQYCSYALSYAYTIQPSTCQNVPECLACIESFDSASTSCSGSFTYCSPQGDICGHFVSSGAHAYSGEVGSAIISIAQVIQFYFTKGFDGVVVTYSLDSLNGEVMSINDKSCSISTGSCGDKSYIDCTDLDQGWFDLCTYEYSETNNALRYFYYFWITDPCKYDTSDSPTPVSSDTATTDNNIPGTPSPSPVSSDNISATIRTPPPSRAGYIQTPTIMVMIPTATTMMPTIIPSITVGGLVPGIISTAPVGGAGPAFTPVVGDDVPVGSATAPVITSNGRYSSITSSSYYQYVIMITIMMI